MKCDDEDVRPKVMESGKWRLSKLGTATLAQCCKSLLSLAGIPTHLLSKVADRSERASERWVILIDCHHGWVRQSMEVVVTPLQLAVLCGSVVCWGAGA